MNPFSFKELRNLIPITSIQLLFLVAFGFRKWLAFHWDCKISWREGANWSRILGMLTTLGVFFEVKKPCKNDRMC